KDALDGAFNFIAQCANREVRKLMVIEDDEAQRTSIAELLSKDNVEISAVATGSEALDKLVDHTYDCMILDLMLPDMSGLELLERLHDQLGGRRIPVIIYTSKDLTRDEENHVRHFAQAVIVKDSNSQERLLFETAQFLHRVVRDQAAPPEEGAGNLAGKKVLVVDDDVRNIFALASVLESHQLQVLYAENGRDGIEMLKANPDVDVVLMDVMMPEMDGYQTMEAIRQMPEFAELPIISLTAKAMPGDREQCIAAGASDYISKPVDTEQLVALLRRWVAIRTGSSVR
ncbi:MAG TPA: response regulator, partial [Oscillatoriaceae cyanobacterium]